MPTTRRATTGLHGEWGWSGRAPRRGCATERGALEGTRARRYCGAHSPLRDGNRGDYWVCTRDAGHVGDHVACSDNRVFARWGGRPLPRTRRRRSHGA